MKIGTTEKLKFKNLQRRLRLPLWQAVGLLEALWKVVVCRNTPAGDVGRLSNEDIAGLLEWDGDADELVDALVATGWVDSDPVHRLLIHDWEQECEGWLKGNLTASRKEFARPASKVASNGACEPASAGACVGASSASPPIPSHTIPSPPPPRSEIACGEGATWAAVAEVLGSEGVSMVDVVIDDCRNRRNTPTNAMTVIEQFRQLSPRPGVGLLVSKLRNMREGSKVTWPTEYTRVQIAAKRDADLTDRAKKSRAGSDADKAARAKEIAEYERLDALHGEKLNKTPRKQLRELIRAALPVQAEFLIQSLPTKGAPGRGYLRTQLLQHLAKDDQTK